MWYCIDHVCFRSVLWLLPWLHDCSAWSWHHGCFLERLKQTSSQLTPAWIDLYPLLRNYDVWGETVGINWNTKRWRYGEQSGKVSIPKEPNSCKRGQKLRKLLLGKLLSLCKLSLCDRLLHAENENERFVRLSQYQLRVSKWIVRLHFILR